MRFGACRVAGAVVFSDCRQCANAPDRLAARVTISRPEQGWSLLCNGIVLFDDGGALLPGGQEVILPATAPLAAA